MVKSMTGYGRGEWAGSGITLVVEVRSVNHRFFDCSVRIPRRYLRLEEGIRRRVQEVISRGKVEVFVTVEDAGTRPVEVQIGTSVAQGYALALQQLKETYHLSGEISLELFSSLPEVLSLEPRAEDWEQLEQDMGQSLDQALKECDEMRRREGGRLWEDIMGRVDQMRKLVAQVELRSPQRVQEYRTRLESRLGELMKGTPIDPSRILTEAAIFAEKTAVDEETVRLHSHLDQLEHHMNQGGPVGRRLDFLLQELNREVNTIGSKSNDLATTGDVLEMKGELEKIREQIQNLE